MATALEQVQRAPGDAGERGAGEGGSGGAGAPAGRAAGGATAGAAAAGGGQTARTEVRGARIAAEVAKALDRRHTF